MKVKKIFCLIVVAFCIILNSIAYAGNGAHGSAPNSGDGIPDGSGFDGHYGPWK